MVPVTTPGGKPVGCAGAPRSPWTVVGPVVPVLALVTDAPLMTA